MAAGEVAAGDAAAAVAAAGSQTGSPVAEEAAVAEVAVG
jgi:hypothetical protein